MRIARTKENSMLDAELLSCCLCGEQNFDKLYVQHLGLGFGMTGNEYSFCRKCWNSKKLGQKILNLLGYSYGAYIKEEYLDITEV